jgi:acetyl/propionyl-CoA carboxylase alpha subunit
VSEPVDVRPLGAGRFLLASGERRRLAYAVTHGTQTWVFIEGRVHLVDTNQAGTSRRSAARDAQQALAAPMPATVVSVSVAEGDQVAHGDVLVMLEAMKMELPLKAPRDGTIKSVSCRAGDLVQPGVVLVELV